LAEQVPTGIVLAGGRSSRFGSDKASALFRGEAMLQIACRALEPLISRLVIVRAEAQHLPDITVTVPVDVVVDEMPAQGPLEGMRAGLGAAASDVAFVVATDLPLLQAATVEFILDALRAFDAAVPSVGGRAQPLVAAYRVATTLSAVQGALAAGDRSVASALGRLDVRLLDEEELRVVDPDLLSLRNANTPEQLAVLESLIGR
jgi:molybdopterin-guanine dinucleotide biosynthesis protein A